MPDRALFARPVLGRPHAVAQAATARCARCVRATQVIFGVRKVLCIEKGAGFGALSNMKLFIDMGVAALVSSQPLMPL